MLSTYRLQLNRGFTLCDARATVPYLHGLGVTDVYCSPILAARSGSTHGYDVVDPARLNPELGTEEDLRALVAELRSRDMGLLLDIVPNHMGASAENPYWDDVLQRGEASRFARWFDIDWTATSRPRVVLPVLGDELDAVLSRGELTVDVSESGGARFRYFTHSFPIDPATLPPELQLAQWDPEAVTDANALFGGQPGGADRVRALLDLQHYALVFWRRGPVEINYRRFFDVNDLVAVRQEDPQVFDETHALVLRWVEERLVDGLRVDHVDGLRDPHGYLTRLRSECDARRPDGVAIYVEKILSPGEQLRGGWPVQGTTGYEFLNDLEDIFIAPEGFADVESCYRRVSRTRARGFGDAARQGKRAVLSDALQADVRRCVTALLEGGPESTGQTRGANAARLPQQWTRDELERGVAAFITELPVYRTYIDATAPAHADDVRQVERAVAGVRQHDPANADVAAFIGDVILCRAGLSPERRLAFVEMLQQVSGPATAKGVEDTALYVYVPLASRNEVGGSPDRPLENAVARLHDSNTERALAWPRSILSTNTHDTKRSADMRARLDVLSELPHEWNRSVRRWQRLNRKHRRTIRGRPAPDSNAEYLLYQALVGLWPAPRPGRRADDLPGQEWLQVARERVRQYMLKAVREAKARTSWVNPDRHYEAALMAFIDAVLTPEEDAPFLNDLARFVSCVAPLGLWNTMSRLALHLTAPGVPDMYQGDELWHFAFVDPDNRRPVDYARRRDLLQRHGGTLPIATGAIEALDPADPALKLRVTSNLLHLRRRHPLLFERGGYQAVDIQGARARNAVAFVRSLPAIPAGPRVVTVVGRLLGGVPASADARFDWRDTRLQLGSLAPTGQGFWRCAITGRMIQGSPGTIELASVLSGFPASVLEWNGLPSADV